MRLSWFTWMTSKREAKLRFLLQKTDILIKRFKKQKSEYIVRCKFDGRIHKIIFTQKFIEEHRTNLMRHCYDSKLLVQPKMGKVKNYCQFVWCQCKLGFWKFRRNLIIAIYCKIRQLLHESKIFGQILINSTYTLTLTNSPGDVERFLWQHLLTRKVHVERQKNWVMVFLPCKSKITFRKLYMYVA